MFRNLNLHKIIPVLFIFFLSSCHDDAIYEKNYTLEGEKWDVDSLYKFNFEITDTITPHNVLLHIRNRGDYPYQNLLMYVDFILPNNKIIHDTINCLLADKKGKWIGNGWGSLWSRSIIYKNHIRFPQAGQYYIIIEHAMRDKELKAITDIGIRVEKTN